MTIPAPKFAVGEPAIVDAKVSVQYNGVRVIITGRSWGRWRDVVTGEITQNWRYDTLPAPPSGGWAESALRPLPPEELAKCREQDEVPA